MLTGIPYFGKADVFDSEGQWGAIVVPTQERHRFVHVFNDVSSRTEDIKEHAEYLKQQLAPSSGAGSLWKSYVDLVTAMDFARREIRGVPYAGENREYVQGRSTTWLRYYTFKFAPAVPLELEEFLGDAINKDHIIVSYLEDQSKWCSIRVELPLSGSEAFLLMAAEQAWLEDQRAVVSERLQSAEIDRSFEEVNAWRAQLREVPLPLRIADHMEQLLRPGRFEAQFLSFQPGGSHLSD